MNCPDLIGSLISKKKQYKNFMQSSWNQFKKLFIQPEKLFLSDYIQAFLHSNTIESCSICNTQMHLKSRKFNNCPTAFYLKSSNLKCEQIILSDSFELDSECFSDMNSSKRHSSRSSIKRQYKLTNFVITENDQKISIYYKRKNRWFCYENFHIYSIENINAVLSSLVLFPDFLVYQIESKVDKIVTIETDSKNENKFVVPFVDLLNYKQTNREIESGYYSLFCVHLKLKPQLMEFDIEKQMKLDLRKYKPKSKEIDRKIRKAYLALGNCDETTDGLIFAILSKKISPLEAARHFKDPNHSRHSTKEVCMICLKKRNRLFVEKVFEKSIFYNLLKNEDLEKRTFIDKNWYTNFIEYLICDVELKNSQKNKSKKHVNSNSFIMNSSQLLYNEPSEKQDVSNISVVSISRPIFVFLKSIFQIDKISLRQDTSLAVSVSRDELSMSIFDEEVLYLIDLIKNDLDHFADDNRIFHKLYAFNEILNVFFELMIREKQMNIEKTMKDKTEFQEKAEFVFRLLKYKAMSNIGEFGFEPCKALRMILSKKKTFIFDSSRIPKKSGFNCEGKANFLRRYSESQYANERANRETIDVNEKNSNFYRRGDSLFFGKHTIGLGELLQTNDKERSKYQAESIVYKSKKIEDCKSWADASCVDEENMTIERKQSLQKEDIADKYKFNRSQRFGEVKQKIETVKSCGDYRLVIHKGACLEMKSSAKEVQRNETAIDVFGNRSNRKMKESRIMKRASDQNKKKVIKTTKDNMQTLKLQNSEIGCIKPETDSAQNEFTETKSVHKPIQTLISELIISEKSNDNLTTIKTRKIQQNYCLIAIDRKLKVDGLEMDSRKDHSESGQPKTNFICSSFTIIQNFSFNFQKILPITKHLSFLASKNF